MYAPPHQALLFTLREKGGVQFVQYMVGVGLVLDGGANLIVLKRFVNDNIPVSTVSTCNGPTKVYVIEPKSITSC